MKIQDSNDYSFALSRFYELSENPDNSNKLLELSEALHEYEAKNLKDLGATNEEIMLILKDKYKGK